MVLPIGVAASVGAAQAMPAPTTVYWCRAEVVFLPPTDRGGWTNRLQGSNESLISFAAAVERRINRGHAPLRLASTDATLYGAGVTHGRTVALRNTGGQWQPSFGQPVMTIEVVGTSSEEALTEAHQAVTDVETTSLALQRELHVPASSAITSQVSPQVLSAIPVSGSRRRSEALVVLFGVAASLWVTVVVGRRRGASNSGIGRGRGRHELTLRKSAQR